MSEPRPTPDPLEEALRAAAPQAPAGLDARILARVREVALEKLRFRREVERSARGVLVAAAAGLLLCGALFLGQDPSSPRATADGRPTRTPAAPVQPAPRAEASIDDAESLSLATPPGVLESELTQGFWLFTEAEDQ